MDRTITPNSVWRHFKGTMAKVITVAKHSETGEELVIYKCSGNDGKTNHKDGVYARPKDMFLSEVDHEKYPDVKQKYRLEKVTETELVGDPDMDFITEMRKVYPDVLPRAAFVVGYIDTAMEYPSGALFRPRVIVAPEYDVKNTETLKKYMDTISMDAVMAAYRGMMESEELKGLYTKDSPLVIVARGQYWHFGNGTFFTNDNTIAANTTYIDGKQMVGHVIKEAMQNEVIELE